MRKHSVSLIVLIGALCAVLAAPCTAQAAPAATTVYRLYHEGTKDHHYTKDANEYRVLAGRGWKQENVAWKSPEKSGTPVYRLYHEGTKDHHYTKDENEYRVLAGCGWKQEGIAWYSDDAKGVPVYRLYHEGTLNHHYTRDLNEYQVLATRGWKQEGIAWYGLSEKPSASVKPSQGGATVAPATQTPIMGASKATAKQMAAYYIDAVGEDTYPAVVYKKLGAPALLDFCKIVLEEAKAEGVRAEAVFAQAMKETGWLRFGGAVKVEQCNFCGLGAVNEDPGKAATFEDVRTGVRAQVQHLKAYASTAPLKNACVDPRFDLVKRGIAPMLEDLNGKWAVPGDGYGESIAKMIDSMLSY